MKLLLLIALAAATAAFAQTPITTDPNANAGTALVVVTDSPTSLTAIKPQTYEQKLASLKIEMAIAAIEAGIDSTERLQGFYETALEAFGKDPAQRAKITANILSCTQRVDKLKAVISRLNP